MVRVPYAWLSRLLYIAAGLALAAPLVVPISVSDVGHLLVALLGAGTLCTIAARRSRLPTADQVGRTDRRAAALYLRSFGTEGALFSQAVQPGKGPLRWLRPLFTDPNENFLTLERFLSADVNRLIGPFIALGDPTDRLPPEGAYRNWVPDDGWRAEVRRQIAAARCVLTEVRASPSLAWELRHIRQTGACTRLFVIVSPYGPGGRARRAPLRITMTNAIRRMRPGRWSDFADLMRASGYVVPHRPPDPGTVLGFDPAGRAYAVTSGAVTAAQYVEPIANRCVAVRPSGTSAADPARPAQNSQNAR